MDGYTPVEEDIRARQAQQAHTPPEHPAAAWFRTVHRALDIAERHPDLLPQPRTLPGAVGFWLNSTIRTDGEGPHVLAVAQYTLEAEFGTTFKDDDSYSSLAGSRWITMVAVVDGVEVRIHAWASAVTRHPDRAPVQQETPVAA